MGMISPGVLKGAAALLLTIAAPVFGGGPVLAMLGRLDPGQWELHEPQQIGVPAQRICLQTGRQLIQLRHPGMTCDMFVVEDHPNEVVVQYTCKGRGYGRTRIRRETARLVRVDSQGIAAGLPFEFSAEARRSADCPAS